MKFGSGKALDLPGNRVVHQQCATCGHAWVAYEGERDTCLLCGSDKISAPVSLSRIREVLEETQKKVVAGTLPADEFQDRKTRLTERWQKAAPVFAKRAVETFECVATRYLDGDLSDRCLDALIFCFHLFTELGLHDSAVRCGMLIGSGYFRRVQDKEIEDLKDLADLAAARQWFKHLKQDEWVATVDLVTGLKAGHTVLEHVRDKYILLQISRVHLNRARQFYVTKNLPEIRQRVEKESDWINEQLSHAIGAAAQIEAAYINAQSRLDAAEIIGERLGRLAAQVGNLASATDQGFAQLSAGLQNGLDLLGQRIDVAGGRVSAAIAAGSQYIGDSSLAAGCLIGTSVMEHGKQTRDGIRELGSEVRQSIEAAGDKVAMAMSGLGTKVALGVVGAGALNALILDGTLKQLADTVTQQVRQGLETMKLIGPAPIQPTAFDVQQARDALVAQGLDEANRRIRPYGFEVGLTKQT